MNKIVSLVVCLVICHINMVVLCLAQRKVAPSDTIKVRQLIKVATAYSIENPDMALHFGIKALETARIYEYEQGITDSWRILGKICQYMGQCQLALDYYGQALDIYQRDKNLYQISTTYNDMAASLILMREFEQAMSYKIKALKIEEKQNNQEAISQSYNQIGALYADLGNYELAMSYCLKSLDLRKENNIPLQLADSYRVLGLVYMKSKTYQEALNYMQKSLQIYQDLKEDKMLGSLYSNLGEIHSKQGKHTAAALYYNQALHQAQEQGNKKMIIQNLIDVGKNCIELKKYQLAQQYLTEALELSQEISSNEQVEFCYGYLSEVYEKIGNYAEALRHYKLFTDYQKKIYDESNIRKISEMHDLIESERKDKELVTLSKDKRIKELENEKLRSGQYILISFVGFLVMISLLIIIFARNRTIRQQVNTST
jgi:tetratricopeptide (TPR) repeat protein